MINAQVKVVKKNEEDKGALDRALKRLKSKLETEGVLDVVRAKRRFENPKQKRERKTRVAALKRKRQKQTSLDNKKNYNNEV